MVKMSKDYSAGHKRVVYWLGSPSLCEQCGRTDGSVKYQWANLSGHYKRIEDYVRLCKPCHDVFDMQRRTSLTEDDIREIRRRYVRQQGGPGVVGDPNNTYGLAEEFGVDQGTISNIVNRKTWKHVD